MLPPSRRSSLQVYRIRQNLDAIELLAKGEIPKEVGTESEAA